MNNTTINTNNNTNVNVNGGMNMMNRTITNKEQFRAILDGVMKKEQIIIPSITVDYEDKVKCTFEVTGTPLSRVYTRDNVVSNVVVRNQNRVKAINDKFNWDFLSVAVTNEATSMAENIFAGTVYLVHNEANGWVTVFSDLGTNGQVFTDLETGKNLTTLPKGSVYKYRGLGWTASNKRQKTKVFKNITTVDDRFDILDNATLGGLALIKDAYGLDSENFEKIQKAGGYVGNVMTGSVNFGIVEGYVRYYAKWTNSTNETFLTEDYDNARTKYMKALKTKNAELIKAAKLDLDRVIATKKKLEKVATQDGQMYLNARVFAKMIQDKFGYQIDAKVLVGMMIQLRPGTIKASAIIVSDDVFKSIVKGTKELAENKAKELLAKSNKLLVKASNEDSDIEKCKLLDKVRKIKDLAEEQKIEFTGDENNLLYIADANCIKLDYDMAREITMEVLAFAKCSTGKMSKQLAETVLYAANELGENGAQLIYDIVKLSADNKVADLTLDKKTKLLTPEEIERGINTGYVNDIVMSIAPKFMQQSKPLYNSVVRQAVNSTTNLIDGISGDIKSHNRRLSSDPTFILTGGKVENILNTGEVVINDRRIKKAVMIKYPKMGLREYYFAKNVTVKTIRQRINYFVKQGRITQDEANAVVNFYAQLDSFVAVLPAKSVITFACAGLDFDYDGALFIEYTTNPKEDDQVGILTNKIVDMLEQTKMKAVVIQN